MPSLSNLTVKKNDGTTDITYTGAQRASGDMPATFYAPALGATNATRPELRIKAHSSNAGQSKVVGTYMYPYHVTNSTTGVTSIQKRLMFRFEGNVDFEVPQATIDEAASQFANLVAHATMKAALKEGQSFS